MLDSCKILTCPQMVQFDKIEKGDYMLKFSYDAANNLITISG